MKKAKVRRLIAVMAFLALGATLSCGRARGTEHPLLVIALDGADRRIVWQMAMRGKLPTFQKFFDEGASAPVEAIEPYAARMLWTTALTGAAPDRHGVFDNALDLFLYPREGAKTPRSAAPYYWEMLRKRGKRITVIGPEDVGRFKSSRLAVENMYHWDEISLPDDEAAMRWKKPEEFLGEPTESIFGKFLKENHAMEAALAVALTENILSIAEYSLSKDKWDGAMVLLPSVDVFAHTFSAFGSPRQPHISLAEEVAYAGAMEKFYIYIDEKLGDFLRKFPDANIMLVSAYGTKNGFDRPFVPQKRIWLGEYLDWHSADGFLLALGPDIANTAVYGAWVYDIAPTIYAFYGFALQKSGEALTEIFAAPEKLKLKKIAPGTRFTKDKISDGSRIIKAKYFLHSRQYDKAIKILQPRRKDGKEPIWSFTLGQVYARAGKFSEAEEWFRKSAEIYADNVPTYVELADALVKTGRAEEAIQLLGKVAFFASEPDIFNKRGQIYFDNRNYAMAEREFIQSKQLWIGQKQPHIKYPLCIMKMKFPREAIKTATESAMLYGSEAFSHIALADIYIELQNYDLAMTAINEALLLDPLSCEAYVLKGRIHYALGAIAEAKESFLFAQKLAPREPEPFYQYAIFLWREGDEQKALRTMTDIIKRFPDYVPALLQGGLWTSLSGDKKTAKKLFQSALALDPTNKTAQSALEGLN